MIETIVSKCNIQRKPPCKRLINPYNKKKARLIRALGGIGEITLAGVLRIFQKTGF